MPFRTYVGPLCVAISLVSALSLATIAWAVPPTSGSASPAFQSTTGGQQLLSTSTASTVRLAAHRYGAGYYGHGGGGHYGHYGYGYGAHYGYGGHYGVGHYYGGGHGYAAYGNPYLYRGSYGGYGFYGGYPYSSYGYGGFGYYQPYLYRPSPYFYRRPYAYTPLSPYGVYGAPVYRYRPSVAISYRGCYYW